MTDPLDLLEARLHALGKAPVRKGDKLEARCPAHDDRTPSFGATYGDKRDIVLKCLAGCDDEAIMAVLGLQWTDFGDQDAAPRADVVYDYRDADGKIAYQVVRRHPKQFLQRRIDEWSGEVVWNLKGITPLPYRLPELVAGIARGDTIWICEGEKDADRLASEGVTVTTNNGGAENWKEVHDAWIPEGANVHIVIDNDTAGEKRGDTIKARLEARKCKVTILRPAAGKDAFDHFAAGFKLDDFIADGEEAAAWPDTIPLTNERDPAPFPVHVLPDWITRHALSQADAIQAPADLTCILGLGAISVATLGRIKVRYSWDNWTQPCSLYTVIAVAPSVGKSPAKNAMFRPLDEYEQERMDAARKARRAHQDKIDVVTNKIANHKKSMIKDDGFVNAGLLEDMNADLWELEAKMPPSGRLMADDATIEALGMVLADCGGSIGVVSAEGGLFDRLAGLYNENGVNLDLYLEGWSGGKYTVDRVKRESISIPHANVAVVTTVQPATIDDIGARRVFAARGLVARFLMSMPYCDIGYRNRKRRVRIDTAAEARYAVELADIARYYADTETVFELDDDACELFADWDQDTEHRLRPDGDLHHLPEWVGKLRANVLRLAGLLHVAHQRPGTDIGPESVREAIELADYFTQHMLMISERWGADQTAAAAQALIGWAAKKALTEFTIRDAYRNNRRLFESADDLVPPLQLLTESGWIRPLFDGPITVGRGGKPSPRFAVNPAVAPVSPVSPGGGESEQCHSGTKRGFNTPYLSISDDFPHPHPGDTGATGATGQPQPEDDPPEPTATQSGELVVDKWF